MKKLLGIVAISALAVGAFAQGTITFANNASELVDQWTSPANNTLIAVPVGQGEVQFLAAPAGTAFTAWSPSYTTLGAFLTANPGWNPYGITGIVGLAGRFVGTTQTVSPLTPAGGNIEYITLGWTGTYTSYDAAYAANAMMGSSALFTSATGNPTSTPTGTPAVLNATYGGMNTAATALQPIPEPTSFALAGLGLAALLVFRRRN